MATGTPRTPTQKSPSWLHWFMNHQSNDTINKTAQSKLIQAFNHAITAGKCNESLLSNQELSFLIKENFGSSRVAIIHHVTKSGGTIYNSTESYGMIQGIEKDLAVHLTPDIVVLCESPEGAATPVPTSTNLLGVSKEEEVNNLTVGARSTYRPRNLMPIIPFLLKPINDAITAHDGNASHVLLAIAKAIKQFDTNVGDDDSYTEKAKQSCKDVLNWIYLVSIDSAAVSAIPSTGCNNIGLITSLRGASNICLASHRKRKSPTTNTNVGDGQVNLQRPLELIAASTSSNQEFLRKLTQMQQSAASDKASKSFQKLPEKYKKMILVASSLTEASMVVANPRAIEFFKSTSILNANIMLNSILEEEQIDCSVSSAVTTSLYHGCFLWVNAVTPSGLASCVITSEDFMRTDTLYEGMVLDYSTKFEMKEASLDKLTRTQVKLPDDMEGAVERLKALTALCKLFFGIRSLPAQGLSTLLIRCRENKRMLRANQYLDPAFIAKFLCSIDNRLYQWLQQCSTVPSAEETSLSLLDFSSLFDDVMMNRFQYNLPSSITKITPKREKPTFDFEFGREKKKPRQAEHVRNPHVPEEWKLKNGEEWDKVFVKKTLSGPEMSCGAKFCLKYWVKGLCYEDCRQKCSHGNLTHADKVAAGAYIKSLREA